LVSGLTAFVTVSACVVVRRADGLVVVVVRCVLVAVDSRDELERAVDCRLGLEVEQAARPISNSAARRILDMFPPTALRPRSGAT